MVNYYFFSLVGNNLNLYETVKKTFENIISDIKSFDNNAKILYVLADNHIHALIRTEFNFTLEYALNTIPKHISFDLKKIPSWDKRKVANYIKKHKGKLCGNYTL